MKNFKENRKGITLLVLVITVIVLIILAGISVSAIVGQNGLLERASEAKKKTEEAEENEIARRKELKDEIEEDDEDDDFEDPYTKKVAAYVAHIGEKYYETLQDAVNDVSTDNIETTIEMLANVDEQVNIDSGKNIILDINDKKIIYTGTENLAMINYGTLKVKNGRIESSNKGTLSNYGNFEIKEDAEVISANESTFSAIYNYGKLSMNGGEIYSKNGRALCNEETGIANLNSGIIHSTESYAIYNPNTIILNGTEVYSENSIAIYNGTNTAMLEIANSKVYSTNGNGIQNYGNCELNNGAKVNSNKNVVFNLGKCEINDGAEIISGTTANYPAIYNQKNMIMNGGYVYCESSVGISIASDSTLTVNDGKITSNNGSAVAIYTGGTAILYGGVLSSTNGYTLNNNGTVTLDGTEVLSQNKAAIFNWTSKTIEIKKSKITCENNYAIYNYGGECHIYDGADITSNSSDKSSNATIYNTNEGNVSIDGGTIYSENGQALYNSYNGGIININDGTLYSTNGYVVYNSSGTINVNGGTLYSENQAAFYNYTGTVTINGGTVYNKVHECVCITNCGSATLIINSGKVYGTTSNAINNFGNCEINDGAEIYSGDSSSATQTLPVITNFSGGTLTMNGGSITNSTGHGIWNKSGGTASLINGKITAGSYAVYNEGTATIGSSFIITGSLYGMT